MVAYSELIHLPRQQLNIHSEQTQGPRLMGVAMRMRQEWHVPLFRRLLGYGGGRFRYHLLWLDRLDFHAC